MDLLDDEAKVFIAGLSYDVYKDNMAILGASWITNITSMGANSKNGSLPVWDETEYKLQLVYQLSFPKPVGLRDVKKNVPIPADFIYRRLQRSRGQLFTDLQVKAVIITRLNFREQGGTIYEL